MLTATSQLLIRNLQRLPAGDVLLLNPPADPLSHDMGERTDLKVNAFTQDYAVSRALQAQRATVQFGAELPAEPAWSRIVIFHPKEKALTDFLLFMARARLAPGGAIWLVGENRGGIRATMKRLAEAGIAVDKVDSARHCQLVQVTPKSYGAPFALEDWLEVFGIEFKGTPLAIASLPGVFSAGRVDEGTELLLATFASPIAGRVLDMGCGAGVIGAYLKKKFPAISIEMVDSHALALRAAEVTLRENALAGKIHASDGLSNITGTFDWIVSNPPFHNGIATDYRTTEKFIAESPRFLRPGGKLRIVANAHLTYLPLLQDAFGNCRTVTENTRFRVYESVKS